MKYPADLRASALSFAAAGLLAASAVTTETWRQDPGQARADAAESVKRMLTDLHRAASEADGLRYFAHIAPGAVLFGTDATERWTVEEFRAFVSPILAQGEGWTTMPTEQHVYLSAGADVAWFDEGLKSSKWGEMRGTGVALKTGGGWKIVQYNTTFPVPNASFRSLVERISELPRKQAPVQPPLEPSAAALAVKVVLTDFHRAAAESDREGYFRHLAPEAIYFGTDSTERFTVEQFEAFLAPYFDKGIGWTTMPIQQNVYLSADGKVAWFDESLRSSKWGDMRGTGVLRLDEGVWKIVQYNLSLTVPNELVGELVKITGAQRRQK